MGSYVPPVKIVVPPSKEKIVLEGCQNVLPSDKNRKKSNVFTGIAYVYTVGTDCGDTFQHINQSINFFIFEARI